MSVARPRAPRVVRITRDGVPACKRVERLFVAPTPRVTFAAPIVTQHHAPPRRVVMPLRAVASRHGLRHKQAVAVVGSALPALASVTVGPQDRHRLSLGALLQRLRRSVQGLGRVCADMSARALVRAPFMFQRP